MFSAGNGNHGFIGTVCLHGYSGPVGPFRPAILQEVGVSLAGAKTMPGEDARDFFFLLEDEEGDGERTAEMGEVVGLIVLRLDWDSPSAIIPA